MCNTWNKYLLVGMNMLARGWDGVVQLHPVVDFVFSVALLGHHGAHTPAEQIEHSTCIAEREREEEIIKQTVVCISLFISIVKITEVWTCLKTIYHQDITVEPRYNEVLGTMEITLLYQVSHYIRVKKQRNIKIWDQENYLVINRVLLYPTYL